MADGCVSLCSQVYTPPTGLTVIYVCVQLNLFLMAFNLLLPAYPLDGGRIFADLLLMCGLDVVLAAKITVALAVAVAVGVGIYGIWASSILTLAVGTVSNMIASR